MDALVIGGTGPTGPHIVKGLRARGFNVAILHSGTHESEEGPRTCAPFEGPCTRSLAIFGNCSFIICQCGQRSLMNSFNSLKVACALKLRSLTAGDGCFGSSYLWPY